MGGKMSVSSTSKICFIAPGEIEIPPNGWGALETVLWNQFCELKKLGIETHFVNDKSIEETFRKVKEINPDIIHLHYGKHYELMPYFSCRKIVTNHDGSFKFSQPFHDMITRTFFLDCEFFCLSEFEKDFFLKIGISPLKVKIMPNGVQTSSFHVSTSPTKANRSLCIGKIDARKRQARLQKLDLDIDFVGGIASDEFNKNSPTYLGLWNREQIYRRTTEYANLVILSSSENCSPLVCLEAMAAGLGLVISEACTESLDLSKEFITVIPENKIDDKEFVGNAIRGNREISLRIRSQIIKYARTRDWSNMALLYKSYL